MDDLDPALALEEYPLRVTDLRLVSRKPDRLVWRAEAAEGLFALKAVALSVPLMSFLAAAHEHLAAATPLVPALLYTYDGRSFVDAGTACFTAVPWSTGRRPVLTDPGDLAAVCEALGEFHLASRGFRPPKLSLPRDYTGTWPANYRQRLELLDRARNQAEARRLALDEVYLAMYPAVRRQAERAIHLLETSSYEACCAALRLDGGFCHQDFAAANLVIGTDGPGIFDLDAIAIDLPARDLRKLLDRIFVQAGGWQRDLLEVALRAYTRRHPFSRAEWRVLYADLVFPHLVARVAGKHFFTSAGAPEAPGGAPGVYAPGDPDAPGGAVPGARERAARKLVQSLVVELSKPNVLKRCFTEEGSPCTP